MVWSDPKIKALSKEFVTVADEAYYLYPETPSHRDQAKNRADFQFFKRYGESMPKGDWHEPGTKQGVYMMGPNAEYLEGRFAASGEYDGIADRLQRALTRWNDLRQAKGYANKPIPTQPWSPPPGIAGELILRVDLRDLPRGPGDKSGARRHELPATGNWMDFVKWAWNENWIGLPSAKAFVPSSNQFEPVDGSVAQRIAREVLVDNVRGQAPEWAPNEVKRATISMRRLSATSFEYSGAFQMESGPRGYDAKLYGQGKWNANKSSFDALNLVVIGSRRGAARFNQRENDPGPAPMGVTLSLSRQ